MLRLVLQAHAWLMAMSFGVIFPLAILTARGFKGVGGPSLWFQIHRAVQAGSEARGGTGLLAGALPAEAAGPPATQPRSPVWLRQYRCLPGFAYGAGPFTQRVPPGLLACPGTQSDQLVKIQRAGPRLVAAPVAGLPMQSIRSIAAATIPKPADLCLLVDVAP